MQKNPLGHDSWQSSGPGKQPSFGPESAYTPNESMSMTSAALAGAAPTTTFTVCSEDLPPGSVAVTFTVWKPACVNTTDTVHVWLLIAAVAVPPVTCQVIAVQGRKPPRPFAPPSTSQADAVTKYCTDAATDPPAVVTLRIGGVSITWMCSVKGSLVSPASSFTVTTTSWSPDAHWAASRRIAVEPSMPTGASRRPPSGSAHAK